ncbi:MAG TPA: glycosyltransferase [Vicinamibacterales bacterium]|nr:glycosyltransferase [Vicinamibacterales bacterium]
MTRGGEATRHLLWMTVGPTACGSYRCYVPALSAAATGRYKCRFVDVASSSPPTRGQRLALRRFDIGILQRNLTPNGQAWRDACRDAGLPLVYDIDDDLFHVPSIHPYSDRFTSPAVQTQLRDFLTHAHHVIVSTPVLKQVVMASCGIPSERVSVARNHLHPVVWPATVEAGGGHPRRADRIVVGWQGTPTHDHDFAAIVPALRRLLAVHSNVDLHLFGDVPPSVREALPADRVLGTPAVAFLDYPAALRRLRFDVGIAPLARTAFNDAKSNVKWLEYSACETATVASGVEPYRTSIADGVTGLLADTEGEWYDALRILVSESPVRNAMARAAHRAAWTDWSATAQGATWVEILDTIAGRIAE